MQLDPLPSQQEAREPARPPRHPPLFQTRRCSCPRWQRRDAPMHLVTCRVGAMLAPRLSAKAVKDLAVQVLAVDLLRHEGQAQDHAHCEGEETLAPPLDKVSAMATARATGLTKASTPRAWVHLLVAPMARRTSCSGVRTHPRRGGAGAPSGRRGSRGSSRSSSTRPPRVPPSSPSASSQARRPMPLTKSMASSLLAEHPRSMVIIPRKRSSPWIPTSQKRCGDLCLTWPR
mmetsp:Transcript_787/g.2127  ORF Transcript_787/g.2127 Transcript_787/m.2127 type:complete len:231 (+) Transcript_787:1116-1808(+)